MNEQELKKYKTSQELKQILTKEFLIQRYLKKYMAQIAKEVGCDPGTIRRYLIKFNIPIKKDFMTSKEIDKIVTKEFLQENYLNKEISRRQLAKIVGCDESIIKDRLKKFNFPIRSYSEAKKLVKYSKEHCQHISEANKGKPKHTEESKRKIIEKVLKKVCAFPNKFEQKCMGYLEEKYPNKFKYCGDGSFIVENYSPDAYSEELKIVCLFQGNYFHCNPKMYAPDYYNKMLKKTAQEIWGRDEKIQKTFEKAGYRVIVLWEKDIKEGVIE